MRSLFTNLVRTFLERIAPYRLCVSYATIWRGRTEFFETFHRIFAKKREHGLPDPRDLGHCCGALRSARAGQLGQSASGSCGKATNLSDSADQGWDLRRKRPAFGHVGRRPPRGLDERVRRGFGEADGIPPTEAMLLGPPRADDGYSHK